MRRSFLAVLLVVSSVRAEEAGWQRVAERDGIAIERRIGDGTSVPEVRATAHSPLPPATIMATLWRHDEYVQFVPYLKRLEILRDEGDTRLIYEQIRVPIVRDRDITLRVTRTSSPATGLYEVASLAVPDEGPPENGEYVRVRSSASRWRLAPAPDGGTTVIYTIRADVGGLLPAWIVNTAEKEATTTLVRAMLDRARGTRP